MSDEHCTSGSWRTASVSLISICATLITAWVVFGSRAVSREEVVHMISKETPYVEDRKSIQQTLDQYGQSIEKMASEVERLAAQQYRVETKLDTILAREAH
jgi:hypothetical protein